MNSKNETIYNGACIVAAVIGWYAMYSTEVYIFGEDNQVFQPRPAFLSAVIVFLITFIASKTPKDIFHEMFGISTDMPIYLGYFTAACLGVGGFLLLMNPIFAAWADELHTLMKVLVSIIVLPIAGIIYFMIFLAFPALLGAWVVGIVPLFFMGIAAVFSTTETLETAKQHTKSKMPSDEIERRLADAMQRDMKFDDAIIVAIHELPFLSRIKHTYLYKVKAKKYREMWALLNAQEETLRARAKTAEAAHEYERTKRGDH